MFPQTLLDPRGAMRTAPAPYATLDVAYRDEKLGRDKLRFLAPVLQVASWHVSETPLYYLTG